MHYFVLNATETREINLVPKSKLRKKKVSPESNNLKMYTRNTFTKGNFHEIKI